MHPLRRVLIGGGAAAVAAAALAAPAAAATTVLSAPPATSPTGSSSFAFSAAPRAAAGQGIDWASIGEQKAATVDAIRSHFDRIEAMSSGGVVGKTSQHLGGISTKLRHAHDLYDHGTAASVLRGDDQMKQVAEDLHAVSRELFEAKVEPHLRTYEYQSPDEQGVVDSWKLLQEDFLAAGVALSGDPAPDLLEARERLATTEKDFTAFVGRLEALRTRQEWDTIKGGGRPRRCCHRRRDRDRLRPGSRERLAPEAARGGLILVFRFASRGGHFRSPRRCAR